MNEIVAADAVSLHLLLREINLHSRQSDLHPNQGENSGREGFSSSGLLFRL